MKWGIGGTAQESVAAFSFSGEARCRRCQMHGWPVRSCGTGGGLHQNGLCFGSDMLPHHQDSNGSSDDRFAGYRHRKEEVPGTLALECETFQKELLLSAAGTPTNESQAGSERKQVKAPNRRRLLSPPVTN